MNILKQTLSVNYQYNVYFTDQLFSLNNTLLSDFLKDGHQQDVTQKILFVIDQEVALCHPDISSQIDAYFELHNDVQLLSTKLIIPGGEIAKRDEAYFKQIVQAVDDLAIDRHSYIAAIGGGAILDLAGYAAAVSHRGIKHIRIPTTVLSQDDSGVGVKNGINFSDKKNFLGTFCPPVAVFNDYAFLTTLSDRHWRSGISEAIKVALIKDAEFFYWLESNAQKLVDRDKIAMEHLLITCARLHMHHIGGNDPFEKGSSRPLDFGHWSAHKLEQLTNFEVLHGEAVAIGIALDTVYSVLKGHLDQKSSDRIVQLILKVGLPIIHPLFLVAEVNNPILAGLQEFREHLGGRLTIMLLTAIGNGKEVHEMEPALIHQAAHLLQNYRIGE
ncbi:MAG: 3-dehydroquinate synthase [Sphingobacteriaceae bacterium]